MKNFKHLCALALILLLLLNSVCLAFAAGKSVLLSKRGGLIESGESESFYFTVPVAAECAINFEGFESVDGADGTYGCADIVITDEFDDVVFSDSIDSTFDDERFSVYLEAGDYTLMLTETDDFEFEYVVSVTASIAGEVDAVKLNKSNLALNVSKSATLKATIEPSYMNVSVSWSSSNQKVATVNSAGKVTAKALGTAKITAKAGSKTASCNVKVTQTSQKILLGEAKSLKGLLKNIKQYANATWATSNKKIVTISKKGKATAKGVGTADITATINKQKYVIRVTVPKIKLSQKKSELHPGEILQLSMIGTNKEVTWTSSNKSVATVTKTGLVRAKDYGTATITATVDGKKYKCTVSVVYQTYGSVEGTVTYYFNRNYGQVPDVGAKVYIVDTKKKTIVASDMVDGNGNYEITGIPSGTYELIIVSAHATSYQTLEDDIVDRFSEYGIYMVGKQVGYAEITLGEDTVITGNHAFTVSAF